MSDHRTHSDVDGSPDHRDLLLSFINPKSNRHAHQNDVRQPNANREETLGVIFGKHSITEKHHGDQAEEAPKDRGQRERVRLHLDLLFCDVVSEK